MAVWGDVPDDPRVQPHVERGPVGWVLVNLASRLGHAQPGQGLLMARGVRPGNPGPPDQRFRRETGSRGIRQRGRARAHAPGEPPGTPRRTKASQSGRPAVGAISCRYRWQGGHPSRQRQGLCRRHVNTDPGVASSSRSGGTTRASSGTRAGVDARGGGRRPGSRTHRLLHQRLGPGPPGPARGLRHPHPAVTAGQRPWPGPQ